MQIKDYFSQHHKHIVTSKIVESYDVKYDARSTSLGVIKGKIYLIGGLVIDFAEFIKIEGHTVVKLKYRYAILSKKRKIIIRWDNSPHFPNLKTFPHHVHINNKIEESAEVGIQEVLEVAKTISSGD
ncbi:MAG: hypothetical protein J7L47_03240 [Candidatus Odinarchaeota archaeon]|nr:hypothetical protein [Candidatus Odinarchaeota archaeon]